MEKKNDTQKVKYKAQNDTSKMQRQDWTQGPDGMMETWALEIRTVEWRVI